MVKRYFLYLALTLLPLLTPLPLWANLEATVDRTRIESDETFVLTLTTDKTKMFSSPDIQPLEQDFVILGRNQSSQTSIINGQSSSSTRWNYTLAPRREGTLTIPAIRLGKEVSQPISIEVFPSGASAGTVPGAAPGSLSGSDADAAGTKPVQLELSAEQTEGYVQQQFVVTLRLLHTVSLSGLDGFDLLVPGATVHPLGQPVQYQKQIKQGQQRTVGVYEQQFAVFPQHSGALTLGPVTVQAQSTSNSSPFSMFADIKTHRALSGTVTLNVLPQESHSPDVPWLPAESLVIDQSWSTPPTTWRVGDTVTRTITLDVVGLTGKQLPRLESSLPDAFRVYPEEPVFDTQVLDTTLTGRGTYRMAVVPMHSGTFELPPVEVTWFNTRARRMETARLPAQSVQVAPAVDGTAARTGTGAATGIPISPPQGNSPESVLVPVASVVGQQSDVAGNGLWRPLAFLSGVLWLLTLAGWMIDRRVLRRTTARKAKDTPTSASASVSAALTRRAELRRHLESAFRANDAGRCRELLVQWCQLAVPVSQGSLQQWAASTADPALVEAITALEATLYGSGAVDAAGAVGSSDNSWDAAALRQAFLAHLDAVEQNKCSKENLLPPLHPIGSSNDATS